MIPRILTTLAFNIVRVGICLACIAPMGYSENSNIIQLSTTNWEPFYFESGQDQGVVTDVATQAMGLSGYRLEVVFTSWARGYKGAVNGVYDGMLGAYMTEKRLKLFDFSEPIIASEEVFFALRSRKDIRYSSMKDMAEYKIGYMKSASHGEDFDKADFLTKIPAADYERNVVRLLSGAIDVFAGGKYPAMHVVNKKFSKEKNKIKIINPSISKRNLYVMFRKSERSLSYVKAFDKGLQQLKSMGKFEEILQKHGF